MDKGRYIAILNEMEQKNPGKFSSHYTYQKNRKDNTWVCEAYYTIMTKDGKKEITYAKAERVGSKKEGKRMLAELFCSDIVNRTNKSDPKDIGTKC